MSEYWEEEVIELAKFMHKTYEDKAKYYGWGTQEKTRVPFENLPLSNQRTMCAVAKEVLAKQRIQFLKEVRGKVIGKNEKQFQSGYNRSGINERNNFREEQLKKLKELEKGVE